MQDIFTENDLPEDIEKEKVYMASENNVILRKELLWQKGKNL